jgi:hypothetical protein
MDFTNLWKELVILIKVWLRWKVRNDLLLVLPKDFWGVVTRKCQCRFYYFPPQNLYRNSKFRCRHSSINKAFEVEILKIK